MRALPLDSLSFGQVRGYVWRNWRNLSTPGQPMPSYIQLDHVYGLAGFDLNMSRAPPVAHTNSQMCQLGVQLGENSAEERGLDISAIAIAVSSTDVQVKSKVKTPWIFA